jgi:hypothetical protein
MSDDKVRELQKRIDELKKEREEMQRYVEMIDERNIELDVKKPLTKNNKNGNMT